MDLDHRRDRYQAEVQRVGERTVVAVTGEIDLACADQLLATVRGELALGPVLLDLAGVSFIDSSGIAVLDKLMLECRSKGWSLLIGAVFQKPVEDLLQLVGIKDLLPIAPAGSS